MNETGIWELEKHSLLVFRTTPSKSTWRVNFRKYTWSPVQQRLSSRIITVGRFTTASILWLSWFPGSTGMGNLEPQTRPQPLPGSRPKYLYAFQGSAPWSRPQGRCGSEEPWRLKDTGSAHKRTSPPATRWGERARKRPLVWWRDRVQGLAIVGNTSLISVYPTNHYILSAFLLSLTHFSYQSLLFPYFLVFLPFSHYLLTIFMISTIIFEQMMPRALFRAPSLYFLGPPRHFNSAVLQSPPTQHVSEFIIFFPKLALHFVSSQWPHHSLGEPDWCTFFSPLSLVPS